MFIEVLEPLWDLQTRVFLKMLGHIIQTYSYIFVIYIIVNTTVTDIAPISNLIFPNSLLIDAESSVQLHSYFKKQKHLNSFMSLSKLNLLIKVVTFGF